MTPSADTLIPHTYTSKSLEKKGKNKTSLQEELGWPLEAKRPMVCLPSGMSDKLGGKLFSDILPGLLSLPIEILVVGKGSSAYGELFTELSTEHDHRISIIPNDDASIAKMYAAADMALFLTDESAEEVSTCLQYGVVPIALEPASKNAILKDYNPIQETGNAFLFAEESIWSAYAAIVRAVETHRFPFDWRTIQRQCMETVK